MLQKRFINLLNLPSKTKGIISLTITAILILGIIVLSAGCKQNIGPNTADGIIYKNDALGFSLVFPRDWKDTYIIKESADSISIFDKKIYENYNGLGRLFTIERFSGELITNEDMQQAPVGQQIILQGNGYTYIIKEPSDVQYPPDEEVSREYEVMSEQIPEISHSISLLGDKKPKAVNEGFKVAGSSFFTVEIPNNWGIRPIAGFLAWDIYAGNNNVGNFELIPYQSEGTDNTTTDDSIIREYLFNDENSREMVMTFRPEYVNQVTMEKIKTSFEFKPGPYNVVDLQSTAQQYLDGGGTKIFGTINDFQMENGEPVAVRVNVMKWLTDKPNDYPNGFRMEDLKRTETLPLDGVHIAPLVALDYTHYGVYEMPLLDETFINNYIDYKNFYYDFIIGNDGQLKIVLGHYVP